MQIKWTLYILSIVYCFFTFTNMSIVSVMVPEMKETFSILDANVGYLSAAMFYVYAPLQLIVGYFIDKYGAKITMTFGFFTMAIGSILFGLTESFSAALVARGLIGLGSSFSFVCVTYVPPHFFRKERVNFLICLALGLAFLGPIFVQTVFPYFMNLFGWRYAITAHGTLMAITGLITVFSLWKLSEYKAGFNSLVYFWSICKRRQTWIVGITSGFFYLVSSTFGYLWGVPYFIDVGGFSLHTAGLLTSALFVGGIIFAPIIGYLSDTRFTEKALILFLSLLGAVVFALMIQFPVPLWLLFIIMFIIGICAAGENLCYVVAFKKNPHEAKGMAVGIVNFIVIVTTSIFQPLVGALIENTGKFNIVIWVFPVMLVLTFIGALFIKGKHNDQEREVG